MSGGSPRTQTVTNQVQYPAWLEGPMRDNIGAANQLAADMGERGYQGYNPTDRIANFNDLQLNSLQAARDSVGNWTPMLQRGADQNAAASSLAMQAAGRNLGDYSAQAAFAGPSALVQGGDAGPAAMVDTSWLSANRPGVNVGPAERWGAAQSNAAQAQAAQANRGAIRDVSSAGMDQAMADGTFQRYMNPYTDLVTKNALGNLEESRQMQNLSNADAAAKARAFGGSRHGVVEGMTNAGFAKQAGDLALQSAERGFNTSAQLLQSDMARQLQAQQLNQGQDATVELNNAQNRQQTGLQNANFLQQSGLANMDAMNRAGSENAGAGNAMSQLQAQLAMQGGMAGYQGMLQALTGNQNAYNDMARFNAGTNLQAQGMNQDAYNQMQQFNAGLGQQTNMFNAQQGFQGDMAMRQFGLDAANVLQQGASRDAAMASQYQNLASNDMNNLMTAGNMLQDQDQLYRDFGYQEFLNQQNFPIELLNLRYGAVQNTPYSPGSSVSQPIYRNRAGGFLGGASAGAGATGGNPWGALAGGILGAFG